MAIKKGKSKQVKVSGVDMETVDMIDTTADYSWSRSRNVNWMEKMSPVLMVLVIIMSFALGSLWSKVKYLESNTNVESLADAPPAAGGQVQPTVVPGKYVKIADALVDLGKQAGLDTNKLMSCVNGESKAGIITADFKLGEQIGVRGTPGFFINGKFLGGAFPVSAFKEVIDRELNGTGSNDYKDYKDATLISAGDQGVFNAEPKNIDISKSAVDGPAGAKVTIVEFVDFQCPYCQKGYETMLELKALYGDKIKIVLKHFPLDFHPHAQVTAEAFECARDQSVDKAWKLYDLLFVNLSEWSRAS